MTVLQRAMALGEETVAHRRWFHENAELGLHMLKAVAYVTEKLRSYVFFPVLCCHVITSPVCSGD